jgi:hypothetical protein
MRTEPCYCWSTVTHHLRHTPLVLSYVLHVRDPVDGGALESTFVLMKAVWRCQTAATRPSRTSPLRALGIQGCRRQQSSSSSCGSRSRGLICQDLCDLVVALSLFSDGILFTGSQCSDVSLVRCYVKMHARTSSRPAIRQAKSVKQNKKHAHQAFHVEVVQSSTTLRKPHAPTIAPALLGTQPSSQRMSPGVEWR